MTEKIISVGDVMYDVPRTLARAAQLGRPLDMATPLATCHSSYKT
ncbi:hypothetical protein [Ottowia sp.]|nr:hypothetical protein [Ottowia sp.]